MPDIIMHSYTMRDFSRFEAITHAAACGYDGIELQRIHFKEDYLERELPEAFEIANQSGVPIYCVDFTGDLVSDDEATRTESVKLIEKNIRTCGQYGVPVMNGFTGFLVTDPDNWGANGSTIATDKHYDRAAEALSHLGAVAQKANVVLTLEIHMNTIHDTVATTARLLDSVGSDHVQANPDPGNMFATSTAERDPQSLDALKDRIGYVHFKNCTYRDGKYSFDCFLDDGDINVQQWIETLTDLGVSSPVCIEYVGGGDARASAKQDLTYLRSLFEATRS